MHEDVVITLAAIGVVALVCQLAAWLLKLPAILFLLLAGIVAGPLTGWLDPDRLFGDLLFPLIALLVAVILFEGSLTLHFDQIRGLERVVRRLVTVGTAVTWAVTTLAAHWLVGLSWQLAFLFGAITVVTGPTVIVPMLRMVRPSTPIANVLRWEGIVIDPVGALLAVIAFEFIVSERAGAALSHTLAIFVATLATGGMLGALVGQLFGMVLRRHLLPEYLHNLTALVLVFGVFALANALQEESGLVAVTVMGIWLANMPGVDTDGILDFKETLSLVFISGLFVLLGARLDFAQFQALGWAGAWLLGAILLVARPLKVLVSTWGSELNWRERALVAWIAPRGIVAAAIASLFALRLESQGLPEAGLLVPLTFSVIIGTVVLQSLTARALAVRLGVAEPEPMGFLVVGANPVARALAAELVKNGYRVQLADPYWDNIQKARMAGLPTYYGHVVSEHADRHLDLVGLGRLLALSPVSEINTLARLRYRAEFGANNLYALQTTAEVDKGEDRRTASAGPGQRLFAPDITFSKLASLLKQGGEIRTTRLTESFDFHAYQSRYGARAIPLFALDTRGRLRAFALGNQLKPAPGWRVIALVREAQEQRADSAAAARS
jgi:NhaP-type Na+/H+ or K+/H+ antiporter